MISFSANSQAAASIESSWLYQELRNTFAAELQTGSSRRTARRPGWRPQYLYGLDRRRQIAMAKRDVWSERAEACVQAEAGNPQHVTHACVALEERIRCAARPLQSSQRGHQPFM